MLPTPVSGRTLVDSTRRISYRNGPLSELRKIYRSSPCNRSSRAIALCRHRELPGRSSHALLQVRGTGRAHPLAGVITIDRDIAPLFVSSSVERGTYMLGIKRVNLDIHFAVSSPASSPMDL